MSKRYIDGIYNYCDRWCERCPFTWRCRNFTMGRAMARHMARKDRDNADFWAAMNKTLGDEIEALAKQAEDLPDRKPPEDEETVAFRKKMGQQDRAVRRHVLSLGAERYMRQVDRWFKRHPELQKHVEKCETRLDDAVEIISWYHMFISAKLFRALSGLMDQEDEDWEELMDEVGKPYPKDSDGSAKIAIIAIERSIGGWSIVRDELPDEREAAIEMMKTLVRIRQMVDRHFPDARRFHRPGFDDLEK